MPHLAFQPDQHAADLAGSADQHDRRHVLPPAREDVVDHRAGVLAELTASLASGRHLHRGADPEGQRAQKRAEIVLTHRVKKRTSTPRIAQIGRAGQRLSSISAAPTLNS